MEEQKQTPRIVNGCEVLDHAGVYNYRAEFGRANGLLDCPFCGTTCRVYIWSLAGGGKKCPGCGAVHGGRWTTKKIPTQNTTVK
jgi:hypothetical protein